MTDAERLLAIEEISQVKARYWRLMDTKDWAGFAGVFAANAVADYGPVLSDGNNLGAEGGANIAALVRSLIETAVSIHHGHMPEIEVTSPTTARAVFAMEDLIFWPEGSQYKTMHGWGHYHNTFEKIGGKWFIKTLKLTRLRVEYT